MTAALDPRFGKAVELMRSTQFEAEKASARKRAETIAKKAGLTFAQALDAYDSAIQPKPMSFPNVFAGFDDWMEEREPGHKAKEAASRAGIERARLERVTMLLDRYGSEEAVLAPCQREQAIIDRLGVLRAPTEQPHQRWTESLVGYDRLSFRAELPADVRTAIETAYPMPATFRQAKDEHDYWRQRRQDMEDVLGPNGFGDDGLDLVAQLRFDMVRDLYEHGIPTTNLMDLHTRFDMHRNNEWHDRRIEDALFRDLSAILGTTTP